MRRVYSENSGTNFREKLLVTRATMVCGAGLIMAVTTAPYCKKRNCPQGAAKNYGLIINLSINNTSALLKINLSWQLLPALTAWSYDFESKSNTKITNIFTNNPFPYQSSELRQKA
jgi:hypothetical protein